MKGASNISRGCLSLEGGGDVHLQSPTLTAAGSFEKVTGLAVLGCLRRWSGTICFEHAGDAFPGLYFQGPLINDSTMEREVN
jgi:hypothetical protein